ncbi:MAG: hypothetical protein Kow00129_12590 [Thermoleophilia bacterium]
MPAPATALPKGAGKRRVTSSTTESNAGNMVGGIEKNCFDRTAHLRAGKLRFGKPACGRVWHKRRHKRRHRRPHTEGFRFLQPVWWQNRPVG